MTKELIQQARQYFGDDVVIEVVSLVRMSDPDGVWSLYQDMGMEDHVECVEMLYFDNE